MANHRLDLGALAAATRDIADPQRQTLLGWGPGRVDVTSVDGRLPVRIPDLRPTRWLSHLQIDGNVRQISLASLAIRIETLIITAHNQALRPPRIVTLALAAYLWGLADALPPAGNPPPPFVRHCARCHGGEGLTGPPRPYAEIGTDPAAALSPDRRTGFYRVPSLRGVGSRGPLLHDGTLANVEALLGSARFAPSFSGRLHGSGAVPGHDYGLGLDVDELRTILTFLVNL